MWMNDVDEEISGWLKRLISRCFLCCACASNVLSKPGEKNCEESGKGSISRLEA